MTGTENNIIGNFFNGFSKFCYKTAEDFDRMRNNTVFYNTTSPIWTYGYNNYFPTWGFGPYFGMWDPFCFGTFGGFAAPYIPLNPYVPTYSSSYSYHNSSMPLTSSIPDMNMTLNIPASTIATLPVQQQTETPVTIEVQPSQPVQTSPTIFRNKLPLFHLNTFDDSEFYNLLNDIGPNSSTISTQGQQQYVQQSYSQPAQTYTQPQVSQRQVAQQQVAQGYQPNGNVHDTLNYIDGLLGKNQPASSQTGSTSFGSSWGMTSPQQKQETFISTQNTRGEITTPSWYESLAEKVEKKEPLSEEEKSLKANFDKMYEKYNPYLMRNGYPVDERQGIRKLNSFGNKIHQLMAKLVSKDRNGMERFINSCSQEELAAIEFHFNAMTEQYAEVTGGKTLRAMIKDCTIMTGATWLNETNAQCSRVFDKLDEAAMMSPRNVAYALHQAINNHHIGGLGFDEPRTQKLIQAALKKGPKFMDAVKNEYGACSGGHDLSATIDNKLFKDEKTESLKSEVDKA